MSDIKEIDISNQLINISDKHNFDQENIFKFDKLNFKEVETNVYTLKINSKSRNLLLEPNPFNFELTFNENPDPKYQKAIIPNKFDHIKKIQIAQILIPRFIPREYMGEPVNGITPIYNSENTITLSYYPGININNTVISGTDLDSSGNTITKQIEVLELVDLNNRKIYLLAVEYNNPYYLSKYINIKADLYSYLNINDNIYPIKKINGTLIQLCDKNSPKINLPFYTNNRLIIGDYYKNVTCIYDELTNSDNTITIMGTRILYTCNISTHLGYIVIYKVNILNYQYIFPNQYLEYQRIHKETKKSERFLFKIIDISSSLINANGPSDINNTKIKFNGIWTDELPSSQTSTSAEAFDDGYSLRLSQFNFGTRDLLDDKIFYLNMSPYIPNRSVATENEINDTFGVFFPSTQSKDYLYLRGDAFENYNICNLQNTNNKIKFSLLDSNYEQVGNVYNNYFNLYQPNNSMNIKSYLPNAPDITIIMKIEQIERKNVIHPII